MSQETLVFRRTYDATRERVFHVQWTAVPSPLFPFRFQVQQ